jgi:hypothetical protein
MAYVSATEIVCTSPTYWSKFGPKRQKTVKLAALQGLNHRNYRETATIYFEEPIERNRKAVQMKGNAQKLTFCTNYRGNRNRIEEAATIQRLFHVGRRELGHTFEIVLLAESARMERKVVKSKLKRTPAC